MGSFIQAASTEVLGGCPTVRLLFKIPIRVHIIITVLRQVVCVCRVLLPDWHSLELYTPFEKLGETFLIVSSGQLALFTANAEAIHQITSKRDAFPKATESYAILEMYGKNVVTTEGAEWRMHRKITSASFNERNAALVFSETIDQTQGLVAQWLGPDGKGNKTIKTVEHDTMALMLHIIGYVGFGLRLLWAGQSLPADTDPKLAKYSTLDPPKGHTLNFEDAVANTIEYILYLMLTPNWLLSKYIYFHVAVFIC
jgi:cytochrome P450